MTVVVLLLGADRPARLPLEGERSRLDELLDGDAVEVRIISWGEVAADRATRAVHVADRPRGWLDRLLVAIGAGRVHARLARSPIGRLLNSLGPVDQGRVFWRAVRRAPEALDVLREADVAIAGDAAAVKTAWLARRRGWVAAAYYDHRSAGLVARGDLQR